MYAARNVVNNMQWTHSWTRLHKNNLLAIVNRMELDPETVEYSGGALPLGGVGALQGGIRDHAAAALYADREARHDGHVCDQACGAWPNDMR